jgi:hypothetical protein
MRTRKQTLPLLLTCAVAACLQPAAGAEVKRVSNIEAVKGKRYALTREHGPWMIMVASFNEPPPEMRTEGMTPAEAADELVWELRRKGIPAYTFTQEDVLDTVSTQDRLLRERNAVYFAQRGSVCVIAGNYTSAEDEVAQKTLDYIKRFHPEFLREEDPTAPRSNRQTNAPLKRLKNGGIFRITPGQPGPLSGAFLTINPLLTPEEAQRRKKDPLLVKLNYGTQFSLAENPARYTVVVATFTGKTLTTVENAQFQQVAARFEAGTGSDLDKAAVDAAELAQHLRSQGHEAWVWHDRFASTVAVGSFDDPSDPGIRKVVEKYVAKMKPHPETGHQVLSVEYAQIPHPDSTPQRRIPPLRTWPFDPTPRLIEVPRLQ